jgi:hypothetical protein
MPGARARQRAIDWTSTARRRVREQLAIPAAARWDAARISALVLVGIVLHAWNLFGYPRYQGDEGVYMASAWSVAHGQISPYTYGYGHPPLGWALIALWCDLTGGFFTFGTAVNTGRVFMVVLYAVSAIFVYLIALRLTQHWQTAVLATALFSYSPLSVTFQREVLLDNIAVMWMLIAVYLLIVSNSRMRYLLASAVLFAISALTKETMVVLFPAFAIGVWRSVTPFQRRYVTLVFSYVSLGILSVFVLVALLKNEFFPVGTLLGGQAPHVSMITTFQSQVSRGGNQGSFIEQWQTWITSDIVLTIGGLVATLCNLWLYRKKPIAQSVVLLPTIYFLFLARGGVTFAYYIITVLPLFALSLALLADHVITKLIQESRVESQFSAFGGYRADVRMPDVVSLAALVVLLMIGVYQVPLNQTNVTANAVTPQVEAMQWMAGNASRSSTVVANHYFFLDMKATGGMGAITGAPFENVQMYWNVATDKAVLNGALHDNWNNIDYVLEDSDMLLDRQNFDMTIINQAIAHSTVVAKFQNSLFWVTIYRVRHTGTEAMDASTRANIITRMSSSGASVQESPSAPVNAQAGGAPPAFLGAAFTTERGPMSQSRVTASTLRLRSGPSLSSSIISLLPRGAIVNVLTVRVDWLYVKSGSQQGWIARQWTTPLP